MKISISIIICCTLSYSTFSQFYFKDLLTIRQNMEKHRLLRQQKVRSVQFVSLDANNQPIEGFTSAQSLSANFNEITTTTATSLTGSTLNTSYYNEQNQLIKTVDTAEGSLVTTQYEYDASNRLKSISSLSVSPGDFRLTEQHIWTYDASGKPASMLRIRNNADTTYIKFVMDEKGNIAEERSTHRKKELPVIYYYYDEKNRLTDIVRYNEAARRLLPDYVFEYEGDEKHPATMMVVPEGSSDYQKWYYVYDDNGLKLLDACYSKTQALIAKIEYKYGY